MIRNRIRSHKVEGYVLTPRRQLILDSIRKSSKPLDARELYRLVSKKDKSVSLATVYRSLGLFKKLGLIDEHRFGKSCWCYEVKKSLEQQHVICKCCGKIIEFESPLILEMIKNLQADKGFTIDRVEVCVQGTCGECRKNNGTPDQVVGG
jgi:Fe2+ or Zn2+ uptake regulation protein